MVSHWSFSDSKSQVSWILLSIPADLNKAVVWMVFTCPLISKSFSPCINPLVTVLRVPVGITVATLFYSFFQFPSKVQVLIHLFDFFSFYSVVSRSVRNTVFFYFLFFLQALVLVVWSRLGDSIVFQNPRRVFVSHFLGQILGCSSTIGSFGRISIACTIPRGSPCPPSCV